MKLTKAKIERWRFRTQGVLPQMPRIDKGKSDLYYMMKEDLGQEKANMTLWNKLLGEFTRLLCEGKVWDQQGMRVYCEPELTLNKESYAVKMSKDYTARWQKGMMAGKAPLHIIVEGCCNRYSKLRLKGGEMAPVKPFQDRQLKSFT